MSQRKQPEEFAEVSPYLWDGTGAPDSEVQQLENALSRYRHSGANFDASAIPRNFPGFSSGNSLLPRLAAAAVILLALAASCLLLFTRNPGRVIPAGWNVASVNGSSQVGSTSIHGSSATARLSLGQTLVTNKDSRATITVADIGEIQVDPDSRLRLLQSRDDRKRISLEVGTIHAAIWAPPGEFVVDTPSAVAVDLGCAYTLHVEPDGSGTLRTTLGWVGFHLHGHDSFIPAGAMCSTRPNTGPGTPYFEDCSEQLRDALHQFDFYSLSPEARSAAVDIILSQARPRDGLTLWHLLSRTEGEDRARVYARFATLVPPPQGVTRDGVLQLNQAMLDLWWNALNLGDISIWRFWEQSAGPHPTPNSQIMMKKQMKKQMLLKEPR